MTYFIIFISIIISFLFNPIYNNFTSLLNSKYAFIYYIWLFTVCFFILKQILNMTNDKKIRNLSVLSACLFLTGGFLPYHPQTSDIFSSLHVIFSIMSIIITYLIIYQLIINTSYQHITLSNSLNQWFYWSLSIIAIFIVMFGHINGIIELSALLPVLFILKRLAKH